LWPAGHLPHKGGDRQCPLGHSFCNVENWRKPWRLADLPPCGGDGRQARGGCRRAPPSRRLSTEAGVAMPILTTTSATLDDLVEPIDLRQQPADIVALSFTDSDLAGLAAAWRQDANTLPSLRLAALRDLRHPMSVDLWIDSVARHAKVILVRILGGYDWW